MNDNTAMENITTDLSATNGHNAKSHGESVEVKHAKLNGSNTNLSVVKDDNQQQIVKGKFIPGMHGARPLRKHETGYVKTPLLEQLFFGKTKRRHIEEFACVFGVIFSLISGYLVYYGYPLHAVYWLSLTLGLYILAYTVPIIIYPLWSAWMGFAHLLGLVMNFVFVSITWFLMAVPLGMLLKIIGKKVMDLSYKADVDSYWETRAEKYHDFKLLERQF